MPFHNSDNVMTFSPKGIWDSKGVAATRQNFEILALSTQKHIRIDMSHVSSIDGAGVGAVAYLFKRLVSKGSKLSLHNLSGQPLQFLSELGITKILAA
jgi:anti-anti-sigma regulatory factor